MPDIPIDKLQIAKIELFLPTGETTVLEKAEIIEVGAEQNGAFFYVDQRMPDGTRHRWINVPHRAVFEEKSRLVRPGETQGH